MEVLEVSRVDCAVGCAAAQGLPVTQVVEPGAPQTPQQTRTSASAPARKPKQRQPPRGKHVSSVVHDGATYRVSYRRSDGGQDVGVAEGLPDSLVIAQPASG